MKKPRPIEHNGTDEIVCPHCGYEHGDSWDYAPDEAAGKGDCEGCKKPFKWARDISVTYSTSVAEGME